MKSSVAIATCRTFPHFALFSVLWTGLIVGIVASHRALTIVVSTTVACLGVASVLARRQGKHDLLLRSANTARARDWVGLVAFAVAVSCMTCSASSSSTSTSSSSFVEYTALSIAAGSIVFDRWFSAVHGDLAAAGSLLEDVLTLSLIVLLTRLDGQLSDHRFTLLTWIAYRMLRVAFRFTKASPCPATDVKSSGLRVVRRPPRSDPSMVPKTAAALSVSSGNEQGLERSNSNSNFWIIHGEKYDVSDFVARHPGGKEAILLGRGRDCTALFESYHPFTDQHRRVLEKYRMPPPKRADNSATSSSKPPAADIFYDVLRRRVFQTLKDKGIDPVADRGATPLRICHYLFVLAGTIVSGIAHCRGWILGSFVFAVFGWLLGSLGHDGGHFAVSRSTPWINDAAVWGMFLLCNPVMWQQQHTYAHHSHTNSVGMDPDLHHFENFMRVFRSQKYARHHRYQSNWLYVMLSFSLVVIGTCIWIPWGMVREKSLYGMVQWTDRKRPVRLLLFSFHFAAYVAFVAVPPFLVHSSRWTAFLAVMLHMTTSGLIFALFSQVNHLNEQSLDEKAIVERKKSLDPALANSWALLQVEHSNNFATDSLLWHLLSNGLNLQIEHHLFPGINHCHLHHITSVVRSTCEEFGVNYKSYESWRDVLKATLDWLDKLAVRPAD